MSHNQIIKTATIKTDDAIHTIALIHDTAHGTWERKIMSTDPDWNVSIDFNTFEKAYARYNRDLNDLGGAPKLTERQQWVASKVEGYMERLEDEISEDVSDYAPNEAAFHEADSDDRNEARLQETASELESEIKDGIRAYFAK